MTDLSNVSDEDLLALLARAVRGSASQKLTDIPPARAKIRGALMPPKEGAYFTIWLLSGHRTGIFGVRINDEQEVDLWLGPNFIPAESFDENVTDKALVTALALGDAILVPPGTTPPLTAEMRRSLFVRATTNPPHQTREERIYALEQALKYVTDFEPQAIDRHCVRAPGRPDIEAELEDLRIAVRTESRRVQPVRGAERFEP